MMAHAGLHLVMLLSACCLQACEAAEDQQRTKDAVASLSDEAVQLQTRAVCKGPKCHSKGDGRVMEELEGDIGLGVLQLGMLNNKSNGRLKERFEEKHKEADWSASVGSHRMAVKDGMKEKSKSNILYVIRTWHANYDTMLPSILETWASPLESSSLLIVGDVEKQNPTVLAANGCPNGHNAGLTCKTGHSLALAADSVGSRSWVFVIDDDVYVNTSHLESELSKHDPSQLIALGIPGCGTPHCNDDQGGFCGGGGYAVSRAALDALVDKPSAVDFHKEMMEFMAQEFRKETPWDDITTTCLMKQRGIAIEAMQGLYGWRMDDSPRKGMGVQSPQYEDAIQSSNPPALTFHYVDSKEMHAIHSRFLDPGPEKVSLVSVAKNYDEQVRQHIDAENLRRRTGA